MTMPTNILSTSNFALDIKRGVVDKLKTLGPKLEKKYLNKAMRTGANIVKKAAQTRAKQFDDPKTPMKVWKEIAAYTDSKLGKQNGGVAIVIGVKGGARRYKNNSYNRSKQRVGQTYMGPGMVYYWRFLEFGTSKMKAQPFLRPALANNVGKVTDAITGKINDSITAIINGN